MAPPNHEKFMPLGEYVKEKLKIFGEEPRPRLKGIARFGEPVKIHPFYKFCRWSALFAGITYGLMRNNFLQRRADKFREIRHKKKAERLAREAIEKKQRDIASMDELERVTNSKFR